MPNLLTSIGTKIPKTTWGLFIILWRWKFWIMLFLVLTPTIITSINVAIETNNPTYPFFQLSLRIFTADNAIQRDVNLLRTEPIVLIGMSKPTAGIWTNFRYYWRLIINVWWVILGNVYLIFLPLFVIYKIIRLRNISEPAKNWWKALKIFLLYLFLTNTIVLIHGIIKGNTIIILPENLDTFVEYFILVKYMIPFHGLADLIVFLIESNIVT